MDGGDKFFFKGIKNIKSKKKQRPEREEGEADKNMPLLCLGAWHHHPPRPCFLRMGFCWFGFQRLPQLEWMSSGEQGRGLSPLLHRTPNALLLQAPLGARLLFPHCSPEFKKKSISQFPGVKGNVYLEVRWLSVGLCCITGLSFLAPPRVGLSEPAEIKMSFMLPT